MAPSFNLWEGVICGGWKAPLTWLSLLVGVFFTPLAWADGGVLPRCGDLTCNGGETCATCPLDCGPCVMDAGALPDALVPDVGGFDTPVLDTTLTDIGRGPVFYDCTVQVRRLEAAAR